MIGDDVTVQQLYDFAVRHDYLNASAKTVLDIMCREIKGFDHRHNRKSNNNIEIVSPTGNSSTVDFSTLVEYSSEDLLALFST